MNKALPFSRVNPYRLDTLHEALLAAGVVVETVYAVNPALTDIRVIVADTQPEEAVAAVVNAHNETQLAAWEVAWNLDEDELTSLSDLYQNMKDGLVTIRAHMVNINAGPASPSSTQAGSALKLIASDVTTMTNGFDKLLDVLRVFVKRHK